MERDFKAQLLDVADRYVKATGATLPTLGMSIKRNTQFFKRLQDGNGCNIDSAFEVLKWFSARWPDDVEWPADVLRPIPAQEGASS